MKDRVPRRRYTRYGLVVLGILAMLLPVVATTPVAGQEFRCGSAAATIVGTDGDDVIRGTSGRDIIVALGGNDLIIGGAGHDVICGGTGRDRLIGGSGRDRLEGGPGRDRLVGRAGNDKLFGGSGVDIIVGGNGRDHVRGGAGVDTCFFEIRLRTCEITAGAPTVDNPSVERVVHVSFDGLRSDHVTAARMPNLFEFLDRSVYTLNARTDVDRTQTLPNHTSQFTGLPVFGGHEVEYNVDEGRTVHDEADRYVPSVFDVVHDNGGKVALYVGKSKFDMIDRTWSSAHGAPDTTGDDDGRDKIDFYVELDPADAVEVASRELDRSRNIEFLFFHIRDPDASGHEHAWDSSGYRDGVRDADRIFGELLDNIDDEPRLALSTAIIVSADHGGPTGEFLHSDETIRESYVVPLLVWAPGVAAGGDLYELNGDVRVDPGSTRPPSTGRQPVRTAEVANIALDLLGYDPVPGSRFNRNQELRLR